MPVISAKPPALPWRAPFTPNPASFTNPNAPNSDGKNGDFEDVFNLDELVSALELPTSTSNNYGDEDGVFVDDDDKPVEPEDMERAATPPPGGSSVVDCVFVEDEDKLDEFEEVEGTTTPTPYSCWMDDSPFYDDDDDKLDEDEEVERAATPTPYRSRRNDSSLYAEEDDIEVELIERATASTQYSSQGEGSPVYNDNEDLDVGLIERPATPTPYNFREANSVFYNDDVDEAGNHEKLDGIATPTPHNTRGDYSVVYGDHHESTEVEEIERLTTPTPYSGRKDDTTADIGKTSKSRGLSRKPKRMVTLISSDGYYFSVKYSTLKKAVCPALMKILDGTDGWILFEDCDVERADIIVTFMMLLQKNSICLTAMEGEDMVVVDRLLRFFQFLLSWGSDSMYFKVLEEVKNTVDGRLGLVARFILGAALEEWRMSQAALVDSMPKPKDDGFYEKRSALASLSRVDHQTLRQRLPEKYRMALDDVLDRQGCSITVEGEKVGQIFKDAIKRWEKFGLS